MGLALSTSWNAFRHTQAEPLIGEIRDLGFEEIELSFNLTSEIVSGIEQCVRQRRIRVRSIHNYCPIPDGLTREEALPDYFSVASPDPGERQRAVGQTKNTIDTAARLGAQAVVLHSGRVEIPDRTRQLIKLYDQGLKDSEEFRRLRQDALAERASLQQVYFDNALRSLDELNAYAARNRIQIGIETRFYYREIPNLEEIRLILERFDKSQIYYWHDFGHAQVMENLGFARHRDFLEVGRPALLGVHIHDVRGCADHQPPGAGEIDFKSFAPFISRDTVKVIEAHHPASASEVRDSKQYLEKIFDATV